MEKEFEQLKPFLPEKCNSILDIGCGMSVIDIFLNNHYQGAVKFYLADKSQVDKNIHYGYKPRGSFYNSFDAAGKLLSLNGVKNYKFISAEYGGDIPNIGKQDIVISLLSLGYHYSLSFYLHRIKDLISDDGVFIFDSRENISLKKLRKAFPVVEIIRHEDKAYRLCARKKEKTRKIQKPEIKEIEPVKKEIQYSEPMRWDAILKRLPGNKKLIGAEIGVLHGETAYRLLRERPLLTHIMIDPWTRYGNDEIIDTENITAYEYTKKRVEFAGERAIIKREFSHEAVQEVEDKSLDYVFIDGDNQRDQYLFDISAWIGKIKPGGWIGGANYGMPFSPGVKQAVDGYFNGGVEIDYNYTWFFQVKGDD